MHFTKMHGLGNDYLYVYGEVPENVAELSLPPEMPMTALQSRPFFSNHALIQTIRASFVFLAQNSIIPPMMHRWWIFPV